MNYLIAYISFADFNCGTLRLTVRDADTGNLLPATVGDKPVGESVTLPGETVRHMIINTREVAKLVVIEVSRDGAQNSISIRQKSSTVNGISNNLVELLLK